MEKMYTSEEVAEMFSVTLETTYNWRKANCGPPCIRIGKAFRYPESQLRAWVDEQPRYAGRPIPSN